MGNPSSLIGDLCLTGGILGEKIRFNAVIVFDAALSSDTFSAQGNWMMLTEI